MVHLYDIEKYLLSLYVKVEAVSWNEICHNHNQ